MPYAVISDIHSNLTALEAVLKDIESRAIESVYFTGDAVGYGPSPNQCVELLKKSCKILIAGNHDWAAINYTSADYFNDMALHAITWTTDTLTSENITEIENFKLLKSSAERNALFVHATPKDPENWDYLMSKNDALINFEHFEQQLCFIGHSHMPIMVSVDTVTGKVITDKERMELKMDSRYIINVGSVGQPRDNDPRAAYAIVNDDTVEIVRVEYDIRKTQAEMESVGLPFKLIDRLEYGY
ncbi:metallophosphoesterase family protein [Candidatus Magnetomonas plexicatena]|uniref:metallophosphoesterase family protein n=1 Tax=Candidatus Magnetomonas plexicatena TaxID=2552947 RepID=UPI001C75C25F|nr:metallophosphoesterase family protein [Nitrospirales bacterium LBB_01]